MTSRPTLPNTGTDPRLAADPLGLRAQRTRLAMWLGVSGVIAVGVMVAGIVAGPAAVAPADVLRIIASNVAGHPSDAALSVDEAIVWQIRAPRVVLAAAVGAGLALAGVVLQAVVRNVLADPYVLGINSGASCGAAAALLFGFGAGFGDYALQTCAFFGAAAASALVFAVARGAGRLSSVRLLMAGVAVGYALAACTSFLVFASDSAEGARTVLFWLLGSLGLAAWNGPLAAVVLAVGTALALGMFFGRRIDVLSAGDDAARALGIDPDRLRLALVAGVCVLVGILVAMAGSIGFVGLVVPHLARLAVGGTHRALIPVSALFGAILLVASDILARTVLAPQEIPIGIVTAVLGAPFLLILVRRMTTVRF